MEKTHKGHLQVIQCTTTYVKTKTQKTPKVGENYVYAQTCIIWKGTQDPGKPLPSSGRWGEWVHFFSFEFCAIVLLVLKLTKRNVAPGNRKRGITGNW